MESVFKRIYQERLWGVNRDDRGSSGPGSHPDLVKPYVGLLLEVIRKNAVTSVVDVGCGDWQFSRELDWSGIDYVGVDCVEEIVRFNDEKFGKPNIRFLHRDLSLHALPRADLYVLKDVLQHLDNKTVVEFMDGVVARSLARLVLVTNCSDQTCDWQDVPEIGQTRGLNASMMPLRKYDPIVLGSFSSKQVSLISVPS